MSKELLIKETPYDDEVRDIAREFSLSLNRARDRLIWAALQMGHTGPLVCFLLRGYVPGLAVRQHIAVMMSRQEGLPESIKEVVHYRFDINPRSGKRGPRQNNFEVALRNRKFRKRVREDIEKRGRGSYLAVIKQVAAETGYSEQTVRHAYDPRARKLRK